MARSAISLFPSSGGMGTASSTIRRERLCACVVLPSGVEQSSLSTLFDLTLKCPECHEISGLCLLEPGEQLGPPSLPTSRHSLTMSLNCGLAFQIAVRTGSSVQVFSVVLRLFLWLRVSSWLRPVRLSEFVSVAPSRYDHTARAGTASSVGL